MRTDRGIFVNSWRGLLNKTQQEINAWIATPVTRCSMVPMTWPSESYFESALTWEVLRTVAATNHGIPKIDCNAVKIETTNRSACMPSTTFPSRRPFVIFHRGLLTKRTVIFWSKNRRTVAINAGRRAAHRAHTGRSARSGKLNCESSNSINFQKCVMLFQALFTTVLTHDLVHRMDLSYIFQHNIFRPRVQVFQLAFKTNTIQLEKLEPTKEGDQPRTPTGCRKCGWHCQWRQLCNVGTLSNTGPSGNQRGGNNANCRRKIWNRVANLFGKEHAFANGFQYRSDTVRRSGTSQCQKSLPVGRDKFWLEDDFIVVSSFPSMFRLVPTLVKVDAGLENVPATSENASTIKIALMRVEKISSVNLVKYFTRFDPEVKAAVKRIPDVHRPVQAYKGRKGRSKDLANWNKVLINFQKKKVKEEFCQRACHTNYDEIKG